MGHYGADFSVSDEKGRAGSQPLYRYVWGNNPVRATFKGRTCRVLIRAKMNTCMIEFVDNHERTITSRNAIRKIRDAGEPE